MKPSIIVSTQDPAGMNIRNILVSLHGFAEGTEKWHGNPVYSKEGIKLYTTDERTIYSEGIDTEVEGDWIIFATRHQSAAKRKSFSVHVPGNWGKADAGGKPKKLCTALPDVMKDALRKISGTYQGDEFELILECTHHGPYIEKPCMFIEIGSSEEEWSRTDAGEVIANVVNFIVMNPARKYKSVVVIGGGHYSMAGTKLMMNSEFAVGHVCPKHTLAELDEKLLKEAIAKNGDRFEMVVLDWKGLGAEKDRLIALLEKLGIKYERYQRLSKEETE
ncbi:D-tyrosyl-tRNA(Tyr) deacylase [Candidatus Woesearchaeota archaeon]|nr:D-tyrosyl-tRNA(Tyr) deacylase [Candidatus Woesearchaeota archaeon]